MILLYLTQCTVALSFVLCATSLWLGYQLGSRRPDNDKGQSYIPEANRSEDDDDQEDIADGDLAAVEAGFFERCKMVTRSAIRCCPSVADFRIGPCRSN